MDPLANKGNKAQKAERQADLMSAQDIARQGTEFEMANGQKSVDPMDPRMGANDSAGKFRARMPGGKI
jgi:hypothetical protein